MNIKSKCIICFWFNEGECLKHFEKLDKVNDNWFAYSPKCMGKHFVIFDNEYHNKQFARLKRLKKHGFESEIEYKQCMLCDYLNNNVPISKKKARCMKLEGGMLDCPIFLQTEKIKEMIEKEKGLWVCDSLAIHCYHEDIKKGKS